VSTARLATADAGDEESGAARGDWDWEGGLAVVARRRAAATRRLQREERSPAASMGELASVFDSHAFSRIARSIPLRTSG
jgi:hypothetical protein